MDPDWAAKITLWLVRLKVLGRVTAWGLSDRADVLDHPADEEDGQADAERGGGETGDGMGGSAKVVIEGDAEQEDCQREEREREHAVEDANGDDPPGEAARAHGVGGAVLQGRGNDGALGRAEGRVIVTGVLAHLVGGLRSWRWTLATPYM